MEGVMTAIPNTNIEDFEAALARDTQQRSQLRWHAVYGAFLAIQVRDYIAEGRGPPEDDVMIGFIEEAEAVADRSESKECRP
jgi:hypothetical protein